VKGPTIQMPALGCIARRSWKAGTWTCWKWTPPRIPASTTCAISTTAYANAPASARYKVYIIDEVHMLSTAAFNAFLKTLEEPPEHAKFVFATTEIRKVPVTVLSRCQRFDLRRVEADVLMGHLANIAAKESVEVEPEALGIIARAAEGSVRDSLSLFDLGDRACGGRRARRCRAADARPCRPHTVIDLFDSLARGTSPARSRNFVSSTTPAPIRSCALRSCRIRQFRHSGQDRAGDGG